MIHRYLAMTVGVADPRAGGVLSWAERRQLPHSPWWPTLTLVWVIVQGLFGKYTVTLKLYPAIVTLHLLGGLVLLALLVRAARGLPRHGRWRWPRPACGGGLALGLGAAGRADRAGRLGQHQLRGAGLQRLPACNGQWWPAMDFGARLHACCASWARTATAACCPSRRWWRSTSCTAPFAVRRDRGAGRAGLAAVARRRRGPRRCRAGAALLLAASWPAACPTSCSAGRWWRRWGTPRARRRWPAGWRVLHARTAPRPVALASTEPLLRAAL